MTIFMILNREVRRVPPGWQHPKDRSGKYKPLFDGCFYWKELNEWGHNLNLWKEGKYSENQGMYSGEAFDYRAYVDYVGIPPAQEAYTPAWTPAEALAYQYYETTTEGTPLSPVFDTEEEMVNWLVEKEGFRKIVALNFCRGKTLEATLKKVDRRGTEKEVSERVEEAARKWREAHGANPE